jgi:RNA polymerase sigma-70 factor (ECF subfamily)
MMNRHAASDPAAVDDLVQEVFLKLLSRLHEFQGRSSLKTWIYRIAVNHVIDANRRHKWWRWLGMDLAADRRSDADPGRDIERDESTRHLRIALDGLAERHRSVIVLHYFEDLSVEEIAGILRISPGTVKSRLHYARNRLANQLEKKGVTL